MTTEVQNKFQTVVITLIILVLLIWIAEQGFQAGQWIKFLSLR